ncbi:MAG: hypothetical protein ABUR63_01335 [Verrucomicrobiota bacterium]
MTAEDIFRRVVGALDSAGIPYMLTGSFASSFHGAPRATQDIDIVIASTAAQIRALVKSLPPDEYYVDLDTALDAQRREGQFNIIDFGSGWKVDLIVRKSRPFSREEFDRRNSVDMLGMQLSIASAEDVIVAKLEWAKLGESQRQVDDAVGILKIRADQLDLPYIRRWVRELDIEAQWQTACAAAAIPA